MLSDRWTPVSNHWNLQSTHHHRVAYLPNACAWETVDVPPRGNVAGLRRIPRKQSRFSLAPTASFLPPRNYCLMVRVMSGGDGGGSTFVMAVNQIQQNPHC